MNILFINIDIFEFLHLLNMFRQGFVRSYQPGVKLIEQGNVPDYAYFILSGICKVKKRSDKIEILNRLIADLKLKAQKHDLTYKFHHKLRNIVVHVSPNDLPESMKPQNQSHRQGYVSCQYLIRSISTSSISKIQRQICSLQQFNNLQERQFSCLKEILTCFIHCN